MRPRPGFLWEVHSGFDGLEGDLGGRESTPHFSRFVALSDWFSAVVFEKAVYY
jgi:hypothetical protein